jgi:hypothetical protein
VLSDPEPGDFGEVVVVVVVGDVVVDVDELPFIS